MSLLRSLRAYIGLGPDEEYEDRYLYDLDLRNPDIDLTDDDDDDFVDGDEMDPTPGTSMPVSPKQDSTNSPRQIGGRSASGSTRTPRRSEPDGEGSDNTDPLTVMPEGPDHSDIDGSDGRSRKNRKFKQAVTQSSSNDPFAGDDVVRSLDRHRQRPRTITPSSFADSKVLADEFNRGVPIVLDLQGQGRELSRRLIDFASGVCYVLDGSMEKVSPHVFLLVPKSAKVSKQDRRLIEEGGYDR